MKHAKHAQRRTLVMLVVVASVFIVAGCGKKMAAEQSAATSVEQPPAKDAGESYVGTWRSKESTLAIKREGAAFTVASEGPGGPKEIGTLDKGVLRIGATTALYTPATDLLIYDGKEYQRIDPQTQTMADLEAIGNAVHEYTRQNSYGTPPINDIDFFVGVPKFYPDMPRQDGWGTRYRYLYKVGQPRWAIVSAGPDGVFDPVMTADMVAIGMIRASGDDIAVTDRGLASGIKR